MACEVTSDETTGLLAEDTKRTDEFFIGQNSISADDASTSQPLLIDLDTTPAGIGSTECQIDEPHTTASAETHDANYNKKYVAVPQLQQIVADIVSRSDILTMDKNTVNGCHVAEGEELQLDQEIQSQQTAMVEDSKDEEIAQDSETAEANSCETVPEHLDAESVNNAAENVHAVGKEVEEEFVDEEENEAIAGENNQAGNVASLIATDFGSTQPQANMTENAEQNTVEDILVANTSGPSANVGENQIEKNVIDNGETDDITKAYEDDDVSSESEDGTTVSLPDVVENTPENGSLIDAENQPAENLYRYESSEKELAKPEKIPVPDSRRRIYSAAAKALKAIISTVGILAACFAFKFFFFWLLKTVVPLFSVVLLVMGIAYLYSQYVLKIDKKPKKE